MSCFGFTQWRSCSASGNELAKVESANAVKTVEIQKNADLKAAQTLAASKAECVANGGSYDANGACYRGVSMKQP